MSDDKSLKILVSGDVNGKLNDLYGKVKVFLSKAGKFDFLICVGEFFGENDEDNTEIDDYCSNPASIPITTYVIGTNRTSRLKYFANQSGYDICKDKIIYLGSKGVFTTRQGLSLVYLSGLEEASNDAKRLKKSAESESSTKEDEFVRFDMQDVESLESNWLRRNFNENVDILITNQWPKYVERLSNQQLENNLKSDQFGSEMISYLAYKLKPRYHFAAKQNMFFERIPYRNHQVLSEKERHVTKFLALASVNPKNKPKFLYAFNMIPAKKMELRELIQQPSVQVSDNPYRANIKLKTESELNERSEEDQPSLQYFYDQGHIQKMNDINEKKMMNMKRAMEARENKEQEPCWFCLGGSKVEKHYIVSIGNKAYLAYAKGALNADHLLIIPINHVQSSIHADQELLDDISKYKSALIDYFKTKKKCVVFFERNFRTKHMQIQMIAVSEDKSYLLKDAFMSMAKEENVSLNEIPDFTNLKQVLDSNQPFYYLEIPSEDVEKCFSHVRYLCEIRGNHFPMNFGRDVMAGEMLLNLPDRIDWRNCVKSQDEEKKMSVDFRSGDFKKFDPFL